MGIVFIIGLIIMVLLEGAIRKRADKGELFKNAGDFRDENGEYHKLNYYYDEETKEFKKI